LKQTDFAQSNPVQNEGQKGHFKDDMSPMENRGGMLSFFIPQDDGRMIGTYPGSAAKTQVE
jgi:hypothetical protein